MVIITVLVVSSIRLGAYLDLFVTKSLQMDFSAFYTAGQVLDAGLSPYVNYALSSPSLWDGASRFNHSRFLYPPLAATMFRPLTVLSYGAAKLVWMVLSLISIIGGLLVYTSMLKPKPRLETFLLVLIVAALYHPLLTMLERGQEDGICLALISAAVAFSPHKGTRQLVSGLLFSLVTLLKLSCVFLLPLMILRRKIKMVVGYCLGCLLIIGTSVAVHGWSTCYDYFMNDMPRISRFGENGTLEMRLPKDFLEAHLKDWPGGTTTKDGHAYSLSVLSFRGNATLVRPLVALLSYGGVNLSPSLVSVAVFLVLAALVALWQVLYGHTVIAGDSLQEVIYWQLDLIIVLLAAPLTWVMSTVWLIPVAILIIRIYPLVTTVPVSIALYICALGLFIIGMPDNSQFEAVVSYANQVMKGKYIIGEIFIMISLAFILPRVHFESPDETGVVSTNDTWAH